VTGPAYEAVLGQLIDDKVAAGTTRRVPAAARNEEIPEMTLISHAAHPSCLARPTSVAPTVSDVDVAQAWQALAEAAPRYPHAYAGQELDALA
jgi:hypothetical protein